MDHEARDLERARGIQPQGLPGQQRGEFALQHQPVARQHHTRIGHQRLAQMVAGEAREDGEMMRGGIAAVALVAARGGGHPRQLAREDGMAQAEGGVERGAFVRAQQPRRIDRRRRAAWVRHRLLAWAVGGGDLVAFREQHHRLHLLPHPAH